MTSAMDAIDFGVDLNNLYREETITDMKVASIRVLIPITPAGERDDARTPVYVGTTQLMTSEGPLPIQAMLPAGTLKEALDVFPPAMEEAVAQMVEQVKQMQEEQRRKSDSRIIVPGR